MNQNKEIAVYDNTVSARTYLSYISEQAGGFACIGRDGKLYIKTIGESIVELPIKYFQKFSWGDKFKISRVRYEDGVQLFEKGNTTNNTIYINQENMYIVDQEQIDNIYSKLNNLEVYSFEGDSIIDPALDIGDILIIDNKKIIYQGSSQYAGKFKASISSKIQSKLQEETTTRIPSQKVLNRRIQSQINQAEGKITQLAQETTERIEQVQEQTNLNTDEIARLGSTETAEGKEITVDASNNPAKLYVYGNTEQKTRSGINQLMSFEKGETDYFAAITNTSNSETDYWKAEPLADNWIHIECDCTSATAQHFINTFIAPNKIPNLKPSTTYTIALEFRNVNITTMTGLFNVGRTSGANDNIFNGVININKATFEAGNNGIRKYVLNSTATPSGIYAFRNFHTINKGDKFSYDYRISVIEGDYRNIDYVYEPFGVMPSPEYPSDIRNVGDNINILPTNPDAWEQGTLSNGVATANPTRIRTKDFYEVVPKQEYVFSIDIDNYTLVNINIYDENKTFISYLSTVLGVNDFINKKEIKFTFPENAKYIKTVLRKTNDTINILPSEIKDTKAKLENGCGSIDVFITNNIYDKSNAEVVGTNIINRTIALKPNTNYVVDTGIYTWLTLTLYDINNNKIRALGNTNTSTHIEFTTSDIEILCSMSFYGKSSSPTLESIDWSLIQFQEGTSILKPKNITFPMTKGQLIHKGDYLAEDGIHQVRGTLVLKGTETWYRSETNTSGKYRFTCGDFSNIKPTTTNNDIVIANCTHFKSISANKTYSLVNGISGGNVGDTTKLYIFHEDFMYYTADEFEAYLAEQYTNGTPVTVEYELAEEVIIPYTPEQQKVLDSIETFKGINHIYCIDEIIPERMILTYYPNTPYNDTLVNKDTFDKVTTDMNAEFNIRANEVETSVREQTTATILTLLNNNYLNAEQVNALVEGNAEDIATVKEQLTQTVTSSQMQIEITKAIEGGVSYLKNTLFTIDENGMWIATKQDPFSALYNNTGMKLYSYEEMIARFDVDGATVQGNLNLNGELITPNLRLMNVNVDGVPHTHIHWIGG